MRDVIHTDRAPAAVGPYSQAIVCGGLVWVAGQIPLDPSSGRLVGETIEEQTERVLLNLRAILEAAGTGMDRVVRATVYLKDLAEFDAVNAVYARHFGENPPARACVEVCRLPKGARLEIDAVADVS